MWRFFQVLFGQGFPEWRSGHQDLTYRLQVVGCDLGSVGQERDDRRGDVEKSRPVMLKDKESESVQVCSLEQSHTLT